MSLVSQALSDPACGWGWPCFDNWFDTNPFPLLLKIRAIFVWPWNENAPTKQKQQTNENRAIQLVYRTDTNALCFWLVKRTLGWNNFLEIKQYYALTSYCNLIGQSKNVFSIIGFIWRENAAAMFWSFHPMADKTNNEHLPKPFFKVLRKSLYA